MSKNLGGSHVLFLGLSAAAQLIWNKILTDIDFIYWNPNVCVILSGFTLILQEVRRRKRLFHTLCPKFVNYQTGHHVALKKSSGLIFHGKSVDCLKSLSHRLKQKTLSQDSAAASFSSFMLCGLPAWSLVLSEPSTAQLDGDQSRLFHLFPLRSSSVASVVYLDCCPAEWWNVVLWVSCLPPHLSCCFCQQWDRLQASVPVQLAAASVQAITQPLLCWTGEVAAVGH